VCVLYVDIEIEIFRYMCSGLNLILEFLVSMLIHCRQPIKKKKHKTKQNKTKQKPIPYPISIDLAYELLS